MASQRRVGNGQAVAHVKRTKVGTLRFAHPTVAAAEPALRICQRRTAVQTPEQTPDGPVPAHLP